MHCHGVKHWQIRLQCQHWALTYVMDLKEISIKEAHRIVLKMTMYQASFIFPFTGRQVIAFSWGCTVHKAPFRTLFHNFKIYFLPFSPSTKVSLIDTDLRQIAHSHDLVVVFVALYIYFCYWLIRKLVYPIQSVILPQCHWKIEKKGNGKKENTEYDCNLEQADV